MISHFAKLGYEPIVGDSFTPDTPVFIKYNETGLIDIKPICELINEDEINVDELGREYDYSRKDYKVLCRSGWIEPSYIYRHKTDKDIYEVSDGDMRIDVTEDHSLFNAEQEKIKPSEINSNAELEYYQAEVSASANKKETGKNAYRAGKNMAEGCFDRVPSGFLNATQKTMEVFYRGFIENYRDDIEYSKTCLAGLQYIKNQIK